MQTKEKLIFGNILCVSLECKLALSRIFCRFNSVRPLQYLFSENYYSLNKFCVAFLLIMVQKQKLTLDIPCNYLFLDYGYNMMIIRNIIREIRIQKLILGPGGLLKYDLGRDVPLRLEVEK